MSFVTAASIAAVGAAGWLIINPMKACGEAGINSMMTHSGIR
jgi:streptomycin 6-kinase